MKKVLLLILDGFGYSEKKENNAILKADAPFIHSLYKKYPYSLLKADGDAVGLPEGVMGNSEVGHITIGAGRVIYQDLTRISKEIKGGILNEKEELHKIKGKNTIHIMGLLSDGGVHSHEEHLYGLLDFYHQNYPEQKIAVHIITDGRDTSPSSGIKHVKKLESYLDGKKNMEIASISGRFYAMDRDKRWDRIQEAYKALIKQKADASSASEALQESYDNNEGDEFVRPKKIGSMALTKEDAFVFFNFRSDRAREISMALTEEPFDHFERSVHLPKERFITFTAYSEEFSFPVLFPKQSPKDVIGEVVSKSNLNQLRIAETEKYAHVTYFLNGGREEVFTNEDRIMVDSPRDVKTYDEKPEMSAFEVTERLVESIKTSRYHLIVSNYANGDMVGHTGNEKAAIKAVEALDKCLKPVIEAALDKGYEILLTADHGNCEEMLGDDGKALTQHSMNPVPLIHISKAPRQMKNGGLSNIAPTVLELMEIQKPDVMDSESLLN